MQLRNNFIVTALALGLGLGMSACKDSGTGVNVSKPELQVGQTITRDTLSGAVKGTMTSGHTYYFNNDLTINAGDTLLMQSGVKLIAIPNPDPSVTATPQISVFGTFASLGTKEKPNWITVPEASRTYDNLFKGLWGGIQGDTASGDIVIKWTHLEYMGGPAGNGNPFFGAGKIRFGIWFRSIGRNLVLEDSWLRGTIDDPVRSNGGHISIMRNTLEFCGLEGGDGFNCKSGTVGDIAYNLFIGDATNGPKLSNKGGKAVQTNVNIYNNTIVNCGWRMVESGRSGSTNIEEGARGVEYNNMIVNCRTGFRLVGNPAADTLNTKYDYQYYYAQADSIRAKFYPKDGIQVPQPHDIAGPTKANDPQFVNYNVNSLDFTLPSMQWPIGIAQEPNAMNEQGSSDFRLKSTSPAIGKGFTGFAPLQRVTVIGGDFGATVTPPGSDIGAYQSNGTGNQH